MHLHIGYEEFGCPYKARVRLDCDGEQEMII